MVYGALERSFPLCAYDEGCIERGVTDGTAALNDRSDGECFLDKGGIGSRQRGDNQNMEGQESGNGWKERMDRFERGLEHLLQTQAGQQITVDKILQAQSNLLQAQAKNEELLGQALDAINSLARIAESHEKRISGLEG
jgi:hypothetical protein